MTVYQCYDEALGFSKAAVEAERKQDLLGALGNYSRAVNVIEGSQSWHQLQKTDIQSFNNYNSNGIRGTIAQDLEALRSLHDHCRERMEAVASVLTAECKTQDTSEKMSHHHRLRKNDNSLKATIASFFSKPSKNMSAAESAELTEKTRLKGTLRDSGETSNNRAKPSFFSKSNSSIRASTAGAEDTASPNASRAALLAWSPITQSAFSPNKSLSSVQNHVDDIKQHNKNSRSQNTLSSSFLTTKGGDPLRNSSKPALDVMKSTSNLNTETSDLQLSRHSLDLLNHKHAGNGLERTKRSSLDFPSAEMYQAYGKHPQTVTEFYKAKLLPPRAKTATSALLNTSQPNHTIVPSTAVPQYANSSIIAINRSTSSLQLHNTSEMGEASNYTTSSVNNLLDLEYETAHMGKHRLNTIKPLIPPRPPSKDGKLPQIPKAFSVTGAVSSTSQNANYQDNHIADNSGQEFAHGMSIFPSDNPKLLDRGYLHSESGLISGESDFIQQLDDDDELEHDLSEENTQTNRFLEALSRHKEIDEQLGTTILNEIVVHGDVVDWDDIAGLEVAKSALKEAVVYPFLRPELFKGLREPARGMLLFGPPGTGKTMLARAVASQSRSTFFQISSSSLTSKYLGESEKLVRALFVLAKELQPSIIFVDEIDSLLSVRGESGTEHESSRRLKTEFLVQWSSLAHAAASKEDTESPRVLVLAATNLPWEIDDAARRRFVRRQYIPLPERETREQQVKMLLKHQKHNLSEKETKELVDVTDGYSGSDLTALAKDAAMGPLRSLGEALLTTRIEHIRSITFSDFEASLKTIRPSVGPETLQRYQSWNSQYGAAS